jgi:hypothetical protein
MPPPSSSTSDSIAFESLLVGSEPASDPHHRPARKGPGAHLVKHADDVFDVDIAGDIG